MVPRMCGIFVTRGLTRRVDGVVNVGKLLVLAIKVCPHVLTWTGGALGSLLLLPLLREVNLDVYGALHLLHHGARLRLRVDGLLHHGGVDGDAGLLARSKRSERRVSLFVHAGNLIKKLRLGWIDPDTLRLGRRRR